MRKEFNSLLGQKASIVFWRSICLSKHIFSTIVSSNELFINYYESKGDDVHDVVSQCDGHKSHELRP